jgi:hypothetical protein
MMRPSEHDFLYEVARCVINSLTPLIYWPSVLCAYCRTAKNSKADCDARNDTPGPVCAIADRKLSRFHMACGVD